VTSERLCPEGDKAAEEDVNDSLSHTIPPLKGGRERNSEKESEEGGVAPLYPAREPAKNLAKF